LSRAPSRGYFFKFRPIEVVRRGTVLTGASPQFPDVGNNLILTTTGRRVDPV
jgi:hypothetical protein